MAGKTKNVTLKFIAETSTAARRVDGLDRKLNGFGKTATGSPTGKFRNGQGVLGGFTQGTQMAGQGLGNLSQRFSGAASSAGVFAVAAIGVGLALKQIISAGMAAEDAIVKLGVMFKNEEKGLKVYQDALKRSIITPFDPKDIVAAAVQAQGYIGRSVGDVFTKGLYGMKKDAMTVIADMAAFSGQSTTEAATALFRGDLALLDKYGSEARKVYNKAKSTAQLGSQKFIATFVKGMSEIDTWNGMAEKRAQTMSGLISTIKGNVGLIWTYLSGATERKGVETFWTRIKSITKDISDGLGKMVERLKPTLTMIGNVIGMIIENVWIRIKFVFNLLKPFISILFKGVSVLFKIVGTVLGFFMKLFKAMIRLFSETGAILKTWIDRIFGISDIIKKVTGWLKEFIAWLEVTFMFLMISLNGYIDRIISFIKDLPRLITNAMNQAIRAVDKLFKHMNRGFGVIGRALGIDTTDKNKDYRYFSGKSKSYIDPKNIDKRAELMKRLNIDTIPKNLKIPSTNVDNSKKRTTNNTIYNSTGSNQDYRHPLGNLSGN